MAKDDNKNQNDEDLLQQLERTQLLQLDPSIVYRLFNIIASEDKAIVIPQEDLRSLSSTEQIIQTAIKTFTNMLVEPITSGVSKFSVTPSTIDDALDRMLIIISERSRSLIISINDHFKKLFKQYASSNDPADRKKIVDLLQLQRVITMIIAQAQLNSIVKVISIIVLNLPSELTSKLYNHLIIGVDQRTVR